MPLYAVHIGYVPGVYTTWEACKKQVEGYPGNKHKSFKNRPDAEFFVKFGKEQPVRKISEFFKPTLRTNN